MSGRSSGTAVLVKIPNMRNLIIRIGHEKQKFFLVLRDYDGPPLVNAKLIDAIIEQLAEKARQMGPCASGWKEFDHIEIVGEE